ncbi:MAG: hypothetical protein SFV15_04180 [Polyangiaceae bacterium]|nr:hypothetical protein [Polyangiaceae bacterium]
MPAPIGPILGFALGILFAWAAAEELARSPEPRVVSRSQLLVLTFALLVYAPLAGFFIAFAPAWSYVYLAAASRAPTFLDIGVVLADATSVPLGFFCAARRAGKRDVVGLARMMAVPALLVAAGLALSLRRLAVVGSYGQFQGDFGTQPLAGSPLGYAVLWMGAVLMGACVWTIYCLRRMGNDRR